MHIGEPRVAVIGQTIGGISHHHGWPFVMPTFFSTPARGLRVPPLNPLGTLGTSSLPYHNLAPFNGAGPNTSIPSHFTLEIMTYNHMSVIIASSGASHSVTTPLLNAPLLA